jgi:signal transduction histidine kinase
VIQFAASWVDIRKLELALRGKNPHDPDSDRVVFVFPVGCKIMVDASVRILSLVNQLALIRKMVILTFDEGEDGTMGYLNRLGFFDFLEPNIVVRPHKPIVSAAFLHRGTNRELVEIRSISPGNRDLEIPTQLADALQASMPCTAQTKQLERAAFTVFAELIDNIFEHSATRIDGYAALQVYQGGGRVKVAVSDSGKGILDTLRPALKERKTVADHSDTRLIVLAFREGLSRFDEGRGCGLKACADSAIRFNAELDVRLHCCRVHLTPSADGYQPNVAWCTEGLPLIWGTHLCFDFRLDSGP